MLLRHSVVPIQASPGIRYLGAAAEGLAIISHKQPDLCRSARGSPRLSTNGERHQVRSNLTAIKRLALQTLRLT